MDVFKDYYYLGSITRMHGYNGKLVLFLDVDVPAAYEGMEMVFVNINQNPVPYFIESGSLKNNKLIVKFKDVEDTDQAQMLINREVYLPLSLLPMLSGNKFYYHEVVGFVVWDETFGEIGLIKDILDYPNQAVMQMFHNGKEVLVPINDEIILKVDRLQKILRIKAPEGLIKLYTDE